MVHFLRCSNDTLFALDRSAAEDVLCQQTPSSLKIDPHKIPIMKFSLGLCDRPPTNPVLTMVLLVMNRAAETSKCPGVEEHEVFMSINKTTFINEPRPSEIFMKGIYAANVC